MGRHNVPPATDALPSAPSPLDLDIASELYLRHCNSDFVWDSGTAEASVVPVDVDTDFIPTPPPWFRG